jgi:hypothetical protein
MYLCIYLSIYPSIHPSIQEIPKRTIATMQKLNHSTERYESSDIYGAGPFASTPHCLTVIIVFSNDEGSNDGGSNHC